MIKYCWWNKSSATLLVLHLLARIYHKGCLCCWREDRCLLFTRRLSEGCTADYVLLVVDALLERGFFSKAQYDKNGILTSESIQGLSQSFAGPDRNGLLLWEYASELLGEYMPGAMPAVPAEAPWE